jgi:hypothetical protein
MENALKIYEIYINWEAPTPLHTSFTRKLVAYPDPKRPGMYKMSESHSADGYKQKWSFLYGKCNQSLIQGWIAKMDTVKS